MTGRFRRVYVYKDALPLRSLLGGRKVAEQERSACAEAAPCVAPDLGDAGDVTDDGLATVALREALAEVHRAGGTQRPEAGVHLGRHRARHGPRVRVTWPHLGVLIGLADVVHDGDGLPDRDIALDQDRYLAGRRILRNRSLGVRLIERDQHLVENDAELLQQQPWPQRPG